MAKKKSIDSKRRSAEDISRFALAPTPKEGLDASDPFSRANYRHMKGLLMQRVSANRYVHSLSVAKTARKLARAYGHDEDVARMAGLLHDWDKALLPDALAQRVAEFSLPIAQETLTGMPWTLHGPTAAAALRRDFPFFGDEVFQAIERHTTAAPDMAPLDMIIFVADKIEPTHDVPEYKRLYKQMGQVTLEELFFSVLKEGVGHLVRVNKPISPKTLEVWNWYVKRPSMPS